MTTRVPTITLSRAERLRDSRRQATSMTLPQAIHRRLDLLAELAADVNASRAEIIAMLISEADLDGASLERRVIAYRKKTVGDVLPTADGLSDAEVAENVVTFPVRQPGRPRVRSDAS